MRTLIPLVTLFGLLPLSAFAAENIDYSHIDIMLVSHDGPRDDFEGLGAGVSVPLGRQIYGKAEFSATAANGLDRRDLLVGAGYHMPLNRRTDLFTEVELLDVNTDLGDDDGLRLGAGLRSRVDEQLELRGALRYVDLGGGEFALDLGAHYLVTETWTGFLEMTEADDFGGYRIGARYDF